MYMSHIETMGFEQSYPLAVLLVIVLFLIPVMASTPLLADSGGTLTGSFTNIVYDPCFDLAGNYIC